MSDTQTTLQKAPPAYLYTEYADDDDLQAFFAAYNALVQRYVDTFNALSLPIYTGVGSLVSGALLDWVAAGLYGIIRPTLSFSQAMSEAPYNTWAYNTIAYNGYLQTSTTTLYVVTDDVFRRVLTWQLYKGDGQYFTITWLKRRIMRFLTGPNGADPGIGQTYPISVVPSGRNMFTITITTSGVITPQIANILKAAIGQGVCPIPFQYDYVVNIT